MITGLLILLLPEELKTPMVPLGGWAIEGGFFQNSRPAPSEVSPEMLQDQASEFWRSWSPETNAAVGRAVSVPFDPPKFLSVPYVGYPANPDIGLYIECLSSGDRLQIAYGNAHENWVERVIWIPSGWCDSKVRVVADTRSRDSYIGIGTPFKASLLTWLKESAPTLVAIHALAFGLVVLPGLALLGFFARGNQKFALGALFAPAVTLCFGYVVFFAYYTDTKLGGAFALTLVAVATVVLFRQWNDIRELARNMDFSLSFLLLFCISLFYVLVLYSADTGLGSFAATYRFKPAAWSTDNQLPQWVAEALYHNRSVSGLFGVGGWRVSDRPPLMTGLFLLERPFWEPLLKIGSNGRFGFLFYQVTGIVASTLWVPAIWVMVRKSGMERSKATLTILLIASTGFALFNSTYIWPKMLAGALAIAGFVLVYPSGSGRFAETGYLRWILAGVFMALALLAHGGVFFGLPPILAFLAWPFNRYRIVGVLLCVVTIATVLTPWALWQKLADPPGNALVKFAFAGTFGFGQESKSVFETIREAYSSIGFHDWLHMKADGVRTFTGFYIPNDVIGLWKQPLGTVGRYRLHDFVFVLPSLRFLNLAWIIITVVWLAAQRRYVSQFSVHREYLVWIALGLSGLLLNLLLTWGMHIIHHQSYASILLMMTGLVGVLLSDPKYLGMLGLGLNLGYFLVIWIFAPILELPLRPDIAFGALFTGGVIYLIAKRVLTE